MTFIPEKVEFPPFFKELNNWFGDIKKEKPNYFPDFSRAQTILSISDYSGEDLRSDYQTYSFFILDYNNSGNWDTARLTLRQEKLGFERNMEFKKLKDKVKLQVLRPYLDTFNSIDGLLATFAVHKSIKNIFGFTNPAEILQEKNLGEFAPHVAEKFLRIMHFSAFLSSGITDASHKFIWYTDQDSSMEKNLESFQKLWGQIFNLYCPHEFKAFGFAKSFTENKQDAFDDLQSLSDLTAGSMAEYLESLDKPQNEDISLQDKTKIILDWYHEVSPSLKKLITSIRPVDGSKIKITHEFVG